MKVLVVIKVEDMNGDFFSVTTGSPTFAPAVIALCTMPCCRISGDDGGRRVVVQSSELMNFYRDDILGIKLFFYKRFTVLGSLV